MSIFPTHDISQNLYYYSFYSYNPADDPTVIKSFLYDNNQSLVDSTDISFGSANPYDVLAFLENSGTTPYAIGKVGADFRSMDLTFGSVFKKSFKESQRQVLMTYVDSTYKNVHGTANQILAVTVSNSGSGNKYHLDGSTSPGETILALTAGYYVFDQSDSTNVTHPLVIGETAESSTYYSSMITEGTIGSLNGYTIVDISAGTPDLYYYCSTHSGMGGQIWNFISSTTITVTAANYNGSNVYYLDGTRQPELGVAPFSVSAGNRYYFDLSSNTLSGTDFMLGTTNDVSGSELSSSMISYSSASIGTSGSYLALDVPSGYGNTIFYFDRYVLNMGWIPPDWVEKASLGGVPSSYISIGSSRNMYSLYGSTTFSDKNLNSLKTFSNRHIYHMSKNGNYILANFSASSDSYLYKINISNLDSTNTAQTINHNNGIDMNSRHMGITNDGRTIVFKIKSSGAYISFNENTEIGFDTSSTHNNLTAINISGNGNVIAIVQNTTNLLSLYTVSGTTVTKLANTLTLKYSYNYYPNGDHIHFSDDGLVMAFPCQGYYGLVYKWDGVNTSSFTLIGEFPLSHNRAEIQLSSDGTHVVIGDHEPNPGNYPLSKISVYKYSGSGTTWTQVGSKITWQGQSSSPRQIGYIDDSHTTLYAYYSDGYTRKSVKYDLE